MPKFLIFVVFFVPRGRLSQLMSVFVRTIAHCIFVTQTRLTFIMLARVNGLT